MSDLVWFIYQQEQQLGPYDQKQILHMLDNNMISHDAFIFKTGWKDWETLENGLAELGRSVKDLPRPLTAMMKKDRAPRATINGRIIIHNNDNLAIATGVNISASGIFLETTDLLFKIGEELKLTCRVEGINKPFNVTAKVIRFTENKGQSIGYGLQFLAIEQKISSEIQFLIDQRNIKIHQKEA